jgi:hypothetical protein
MMGRFPERVPLLVAFLREFDVINEMCGAIGWPALFREDFSQGKRPREFAFLLRPTRAAFNAFIHLLDKIMSENLNRDFFAKQGMLLEEDKPRADGKVVVEKKGTIRLLEEWLRFRFRTDDDTPLRNAIETFKEIRRARQRPAHALDESRHDPSLYKVQRELMKKAYGAVRTIRLVLANHPQARSVKVPAWLHEGTIWPF